MGRAETLSRLTSNRPLIAPSLLKCDYGNLREEFNRLHSAELELVHWDVMDGHFVPNLSYGAMVIERLRPASSLVFDAHLMISDPAKYLDDYIKAGCDCLTVHIEALPDPRPVLQRIHDADRVAGLAINPETPVEKVIPYLDDCDLLLVMTVHPGFGGQSFMASEVPKISELRQLAPNHLISVDGGIAKKTISSTRSAGANLFVAGSAIFDQPDYSVAVAELVRSASDGLRS